MIRVKDLLLALSLANLCLISEWNRLLYPAASFSMDYSPAAIEYGAALFSFGLLSALFLVLALVCRSMEQGRGAARIALVGLSGILLLFPLNWLRLQAALRYQDLALKELLGQRGEVAGMILVAAATVMLCRHLRTRKIVIAAVLIASPFCLVTVGQSVAKALQGEPAAKFPDRPPVPLLEGGAPQKPRVLILIFDEMDQRLAFTDPAPGLALPEFARLRKEALHADHAFPPAMNTIQSMPAFTTGKLVKNVWPLNQHELLLDLEGGGPLVPWSSQPNMFSGAHAMGLNTALVGRAIPYSRIIGGSLTRCMVPEAGSGKPAPETLASAVRKQLISIAGTLPLASRFDLAGRLSGGRKREDALREAAALHECNLRNAKELAVDRRFSLILAHFDVPHQPWIYDRAKGSYCFSAEGSYEDNLALADRTLGELRREMEKAGVWENTHLLITSDHWLRSNGTDHRVPFLLKLAGQKQPVSFDRPFNTVLVHDLVHALLARQVESRSSLVSWLDAHRTIGPSPFY